MRPVRNSFNLFISSHPPLSVLSTVQRMNK